MPLLTIQASQAENVPAGAYQCTFTGISEIETTNGKAYRWAFRCDKDGKTISGLSDRESPPTTRNKTGRWLAAISGKDLTAGVAINPDDYVGQRYIVVVESTENGPRMASFSRLA